MGSGLLVQCERTDGHKGVELGLVDCECCGPPACAAHVACGEQTSTEAGADKASQSLSKSEGCTCGDHPLSVLAAKPAREGAPSPAVLLEVSEPIVIELPLLAVELWCQAEIPRPRPPRSTTVFRS